jgi:hypothetical protein
VQLLASSREHATEATIDSIGCFTCADRYRLVREIGKGGMARVFEGVAHGTGDLERRVAVKLLLARFTQDPAMRQQFLHEAQIASQLQHPNIVQLRSYGEVEAGPLIVMEYIEGIDAAHAIHRRGAMPEPLALHVIAEVAHALHYAHHRRDAAGKSLQIVHRDVTPHNVMLSWDGCVKLADFGIALSTRSERQTETHLVKGKLCYLAPEQLAGEALSSATDIYALGKTLQALVDHEMATEMAELVEACLATEPNKRPTAHRVAGWAGELAAQSLDRDGRGALSAWLSSCRPVERAPGALDGLLGLALNPTAAHLPGPTLSQSVRGASIASDAASELQQAPATLSRVASLASAGSGRGRRSTWVGLGILCCGHALSRSPGVAAGSLLPSDQHASFRH